jgi:hypothetical protein
MNCREEILYNKIMDVAKSEIKKEDLIKFYEKHTGKK